eukprot:Blabericola_migrator_1__504@NODE_1121_length_5377_cov_391_318644_g745_i2_p2_GENE_NODE_1121_length_5377_cov_391_318644_g745_i2NODE_1121_length_5377_cov_391_318644_g745_i2_p2_ORF_typecomplete_len510_score46_66zfCCHC_3/PF13917_6/0_015zfCCHC_3/PF13917_6/0_074zfCCHC/PF00098_23/0_97zfCCHC/PF00098_23/0_46zfCCHC_4/PF14392_6/1_2zfCCHC_4/PF14392_6/2_4zfCCHC_5/PF14787_6/1_2e03zfCCHC_5/PF14787_6/0_59_NODE_1121_length_5377_cov_391_318644_g745_i27862315
MTLCYNCREQGHKTFECSRTLSCRHCGQGGHKERQCRAKKSATLLETTKSQWSETPPVESKQSPPNEPGNPSLDDNTFLQGLLSVYLSVTNTPRTSQSSSIPHSEFHDGGSFDKHEYDTRADSDAVTPRYNNKSFKPFQELLKTSHLWNDGRSSNAGEVTTIATGAESDTGTIEDGASMYSGRMSVALDSSRSSPHRSYGPKSSHGLNTQPQSGPPYYDPGRRCGGRSRAASALPAPPPSRSSMTSLPAPNPHRSSRSSAGGNGPRHITWTIPQQPPIEPKGSSAFRPARRLARSLPSLYAHPTPADDWDETTFDHERQSSFCLDLSPVSSPPLRTAASPVAPTFTNLPPTDNMMTVAIGHDPCHIAYGHPASQSLEFGRDSAIPNEHASRYVAPISIVGQPLWLLNSAALIKRDYREGRGPCLPWSSVGSWRNIDEPPVVEINAPADDEHNLTGGMPAGKHETKTRLRLPTSPSAFSVASAPISQRYHQSLSPSLALRPTSSYRSPPM